MSHSVAHELPHFHHNWWEQTLFLQSFSTGSVRCFWKGSDSKHFRLVNEWWINEGCGFVPMKVYLQNREWARFGVCQFLPVLASGCFFPAFSNSLTVWRLSTLLSTPADLTLRTALSLPQICAKTSSYLGLSGFSLTTSTRGAKWPLGHDLKTPGKWGNGRAHPVCFLLLPDIQYLEVVSCSLGFLGFLWGFLVVSGGRCLF